MNGIYVNRFNPTYFDAACCRARTGAGFNSSQCKRLGTVARTVDGATYKFCGAHDPVAVTNRSARSKAKREAKWAAELAARERSKKVAEATKACVEAVARIARGHSNPTNLAASTLKQFPEDWTADE